jgi:hypothetical protein
LVEHLTFNQVVPGSSPGALTTPSTTYKSRKLICAQFRPKLGLNVSDAAAKVHFRIADHPGTGRLDY